MIYDGDGEWRLVATFNSSGETQCPAHDYDPIARESAASGDVRAVTQEEADTGDGEQCPLCEEKVGDYHGHIYIGEGYEAVYKLVELKHYEVVVGNLGTVYSEKAEDETAARLKYNVYVAISQGSDHGNRAFGEDVTLLVDDEIEAEHVGHVNREEDAE